MYLIAFINYISLYVLRHSTNKLKFQHLMLHTDILSANVLITPTKTNCICRDFGNLVYYIYLKINV